MIKRMKQRTAKGRRNIRIASDDGNILLDIATMAEDEDPTAFAALLEPVALRGCGRDAASAFAGDCDGAGDNWSTPFEG